jgi:hypothetical protein
MGTDASTTSSERMRTDDPIFQPLRFRNLEVKNRVEGV